MQLCKLQVHTLFLQGLSYGIVGNKTDVELKTFFHVRCN